MTLLCTSDTQAEIANLGLCQQAHQELMTSAEKYRPDAIVHAGDAKEHYLPQIQVVQFWVRKVREIREAGYRFIILMGNHDRISQTATSKNWLDILRAAGAETVSKPKVKTIGDGLVAFLPFTPDKALEKVWAANLAKQVRQTRADYKNATLRPVGPSTGVLPTALIFHTDVAGVEMRPNGFKGRGITIEELHANCYDVCLGGHIHTHHNLAENVFYVGDPFCMDWSEADATKGHLLVEVTA